MRRLALALFSTGLAFSAEAQTAVTPPPVAVTAPVIMPSAVVVPPKTPAPALEEIGFDPKVKRDPQGRILGEAGLKNDAVVSESRALRRDTGTSLRSDVRKPVVKVPAAVAQPTAPVVAMPGMTTTTEIAPVATPAQAVPLAPASR